MKARRKGRTTVERVAELAMQLAGGSWPTRGPSAASLTSRSASSWPA